ncbi:MAG: nitrate reductase gamma subunit [bacterium]
MGALLYVITYASLFVFLVAIAVRFRRIQKYPLHLRWEIYPVPHEGARAKHGGSRLEEIDWWTKEHRPSLLAELKFMLPEMIFLKALFEHNRKLWYRSFPFHFGLYLLAGFAGLLVLGVIVEWTGTTVGLSAGGFGALVAWATVIVGLSGLVLGILGALGLLVLRLTDADLKPYTNVSHVFNLVFILLALALMLVAWSTADREFLYLRGYVASLLTFNLSAPAGGSTLSAAVLLLSLLLAYIPLTHMSHFFVKWFTWHKIRWDDEPNVRGGRIEVLIQKALQSRVSWSADHIHADGKKNWADIATEEIKE